MSKFMKALFTIALVASVVMIFGAVSAFADTTTPPAIKSAAYDVGTGELVLTGTDIVSVAGTGKNDIDPKKIQLTDGKDNVLILSGAKVERESATTAKITLNATERKTAAKIFNLDGEAAKNGGSYYLNVYSGWNGTTSTTDVTTGKAITVSGVIKLDSVEINVSSGAITLKGKNFFGKNLLNNDFTAKYITITNGKDQAYTLSDSKGDIVTTTSAALTMGAKDKLALQAMLDKNGTTDTKGNTFNCVVASGWNGDYSLTDMTAHPVTVSGYETPTAIVITTNNKNVITVKATLLAATSNKLGYVYVVPEDKATTMSGITVSYLNQLVTSGTALKAEVKIPGTAPSIVTTKLVLDTPTKNFKVVAVDKAGNLSSDFATTKITINNVPAASLSVTAAKGTTSGTKLTVTPTAGNQIYYVVSSSAIAIPKVTTTTSALTLYVSGSDITGVDATTNKYLGVYEASSSGVVKFRCLTLSSTYIRVATDSTPPALTTGSSINVDAENKVVTITLSENVLNATSDNTTLKAKIQVATDGSTFNALGGSDTVAISSGKLVVSFNSALTGTTNKIRILAGAVKDAANNTNVELTTGALTLTTPSDSTPPTISSVTLGNGNTDNQIENSDSIEIVFSENMKTDTMGTSYDVVVTTSSSIETVFTIYKAGQSDAANTLATITVTADVNICTTTTTYSGSTGVWSDSRTLTITLAGETGGTNNGTHTISDISTVIGAYAKDAAGNAATSTTPVGESDLTLNHF